MSPSPGSLRIVSLVPSVTETLLAWGIEPVACTRFCEQPTLRHVGGTKDPDLDAIVALGPDLVVVNDEENRKTDADALVVAGLAVHACSPRTLQDVGPALHALAGAVGAAPAASLRGRVDEQVEPLGLRAFVPIWRRPWMSIADDTYGASLLASIGVANACGGRGGGDRYPSIELEAVVALAPDVVLAPSEPYAFRPQHLVDLSQVAPVIEVDGQDLFWWGVRSAVAPGRLRDQIASALSP